MCSTVNEQSIRSSFHVEYVFRVGANSAKKAKLSKRKRYTTAELMAGFKPEHRYGEWDLGPPVGKEIW